MIAEMTATSLHDKPMIGNSANRDAPSRPMPLSRDEIVGPFSLIDGHPLTINAVPGLIVHVHSGSLAVSRERYAVEYIVHGGKRFQFHGTGPIVLRALSRVELRVEWPPETRLSILPRFVRFAAAA